MIHKDSSICITSICITISARQEGRHDPPGRGDKWPCLHSAEGLPQLCHKFRRLLLSHPCTLLHAQMASAPEDLRPGLTTSSVWPDSSCMCHTLRSAPAQKTLGTVLLISIHLVALSRRTMVTASTSSLRSCLPAHIFCRTQLVNILTCKESRMVRAEQVPMAFLASGRVRLI